MTKLDEPQDDHKRSGKSSIPTHFVQVGFVGR